MDQFYKLTEMPEHQKEQITEKDNAHQSCVDLRKECTLIKLRKVLCLSMMPRKSLIYDRFLFKFVFI